MGRGPLEQSIKAVLGLVNLTGMLLVQRYGEQSVSEADALQEMGARFAG